MSIRVPRALLAGVFVFGALSLNAAIVSKVSDDAFAPLRQGIRGKFDIRVKLDGRRFSSMQLEEFQVWAPDAKIIVHSDVGVEKLDPPARRFYRGLVDQEPESFAFFSVDPATQTVQGLVLSQNTSYSIVGRKANNRVPGPNRFDDFVTASEPNDDLPEDFKNWECANDKIRPAASNRPVHATGVNGLPITTTGISGTQKYAVTVEIETDFKFFDASDGVLGNSAGNLANAQTYITNLTGAVSTIYNRDLKTNIFQGNVHIYQTAASDPWNTTNTGFNALIEMGDRYNSATTRTTSAVVMLSGKNFGGGIAWEGVICGTDFHYPDFVTGPDFGGPYAWCGGIANFGTTGLGAIPDVNTPPYNEPSGTQNYWPVVEYAHELGHNFGGHHTHCVVTSAAEFTASGFTDNATHTGALPGNFVDHCFGHEFSSTGGFETSCFGGSAQSPDYVQGSQGVFKGTIMSYCHNVAPQPQGSRFTFGLAAEPSHHELDDYMLNAAGSPAGSGQNIVFGVGSFTIGAITAPATVAPSSTGNAASIPAIGGATYIWTISNGTITSAATGNSIAFTAGASGTVTLTAAAFSGTTKCGVSDSKVVPIGAGLTPPTNVTATFNGVNGVTLNWTVAAGATKYNIYRSSPTDYQSFGTKLGTSPITPPFTDTTITVGNAYLYKIRSTDAGGVTESSDSNADVATAVIYTNPPPTINTSLVRAADMNDLRTVADKLRILAKLGAPGYTHPTITASTSKVFAQDLIEVRSVIGSSLATIGVPAISFNQATITGNVTKIKAVDVTELRNGVQ